MPIRRTSDPTWKPVPGTPLDPGHPRTRGLVGCWILNEGGGLIALDSSGNNFNGTLTNGPIWTVGRSGPALSFDGSDDGVIVADRPALQIANRITLVARFAPAFLATQRVIIKGSGSIDGYELGLSSSGPVFIRFNQFTSANGLRVQSTTNYPTDGKTWVHAAATYDGVTIRIYINGRLEASAANAFTIGTNTLGLALGGEVIGSNALQGKLEDARIYDRALTAEEIREDFYSPYAVFQPPSVRMFSAAAVTPATATLGVSLGASSLAASATATAPASATGSLATSLGASTLAGSATVVDPSPATSTLAVTLGSVTLAASATVVDPASASSTLAVTLGSATLASSATVVGGSLVARSDDFNRGDSASSLGTPSDAGSAWEALIGTWGISSNSAYNPGVDEHGMAVLESGLADVDVQVTSANASQGAGLWCRVSNASNGILAGFIAGNWRMYTKIGGGFTELLTVAGSCPTGTVLRLRAEGDQVSLYADDVAVLGPQTITFNQTATKHGLESFVTSVFTYDTFSISAIGPSSATLGVTLGDATLAGAGSVVDPDPSASTLAVTLGSATLAAAATVVDPGPSSSTLAVTLDTSTLTATATVVDPSPATSILAVTLGISTLTASASVVDPAAANATLTATLGAVTLAGTGIVVDPSPTSSTLAITLDAATLVASATAVDPSSADATLAVTLAPTTLSASASVSGIPTLAYAVQAGGLYFAFET